MTIHIAAAVTVVVIATVSDLILKMSFARRALLWAVALAVVGLILVTSTGTPLSVNLVLLSMVVALPAAALIILPTWIMDSAKRRKS